LENHDAEAIQTKMITVYDVQNQYIQGWYKKIKAFCLTYLQYKKIGRTYYFSRAELEKLLNSNKQLEFELNEY
jgi:hypothetical protein